MAINNVLRALAAIFDLLLCIPLHLFLGQNQVYQSWLKQLFFWLEGQVNLPWMALSLLPSAIFIFILMVIIRSFSQLVFNRSPGHCLMGLELKTKGLKGRLLGLIYVLFSLVLWPINLVLESLDLFSFSKFFSGTEQKEVEAFSNSRLIVMILFSGVLLLSSVAIPVLLHKDTAIAIRDDSSPVKTSSQLNRILKGEIVDHGTETTLYSSERLKLLSLNEIGQSRFLLLPDFDFYKIKKSVKFEPVLQIIDRATGTKGRVFIHGKVDIIEMIKTAFIGDPTASILYEKLFEEVFHEKPYIQARWEKSSSPLGLMHPLVVEEQIDFLKNSIEFDLINHPLKSLSDGPFLTGKLLFREHLRKLMKLDSAENIKLTTIGNYRFLISKINDGQKVKELWLPLGTRYPILMEFDWSGGSDITEVSKQFRLSFLNNAYWFFDYRGFSSFPELEADMTVLNIFDELTTREIDVNKVSLLEEYIYRFYYNICRLEFSESMPFLRSFIKRSLERTNQIIVMRGQHRQTFSTFFLGQMESLVQAYETKDRNYFNL